MTKKKTPQKPKKPQTKITKPKPKKPQTQIFERLLGEAHSLSGTQKSGFL